MAISCRLSVSIFFLCAGNIFVSHGMKFEHKKYVIVLTAGSDYGPLGKVKVDKSFNGVVYGVSGGWKSMVDIDKNSGKLKLMKKLDEKTTASLNNEITIEARKQGTTERATTIVIIVILPKGFGDQFISKIGKVGSSKTAKHPKNEKINAYTLLRFLRRPSGTAKQIGMAQLTLETKIMKVKKLIKQKFAKQFGVEPVDPLIRLFLHLHQLFSKDMMEKMDKDSHCLNQTVAKSCKRMRFRTFDGTCNNLKFPNRGASDRAFIRIRPALYYDVAGINDPIGYPNQPDAPSVPSPHAVSRDFIIDEVKAAATSQTLTHAVMQFGQFIDHDLDLAVEVEFEGTNSCLDVNNIKCDGSPADFVCPCYPILPEGDAECIRVTRSAAVCHEHGYPKTREQINVNTAYIDASQVYGSTKKTADALREKPNTEEDRGLLRSSNGLDGELLPLDQSVNDEALCNDFGGCFVAGDARSNEQQSLAAFHTLFLREHNRMARKLKEINNHWNGERIYQEARAIMGAVMQKITYEDWLPLILGPNGLPRYRGYRISVDAGVSNAFATGAFRFGHSLIRPAFDLLDKGFNPIGHPVDLRFMFFNNTLIQRDGINPMLLGLVGNFSENVDRILSPGIVRHLFERENQPGSNLAALNIHRHRDHGIPGYNEFRKFCGLKDAKTFEDTKNEIKNPENRDILRRLYNDDPNLVELWVAGLAETPVDGASVGRTFQCVIADQFKRTRDGDRYYFRRKGVWPRFRLAELRKASLSRMYCDNLNVVSIQKDAFRAPTAKTPRINCDRIPGIDLCKWKETPFFRRHCLYGNLDTGCRQCKCFRPWFGRRCEAYLSKKPVPWHASILNSKKEIVCSGAFVLANWKQQVVTTASCAKAIGKGGFVRLGDYRRTAQTYGEFAPIAIRATKYSTDHELARFELVKGVQRTKNVNYIFIQRHVSSSLPSYVTTWGTGHFLHVLRVSVLAGFRASRICKKNITPFRTTKNVCTLPASLPRTTRNSGSPLVQIYARKPRLVGLLTDVVGEQSQARFGKYIIVTRRRFPRLFPELFRRYYG